MILWTHRIGIIVIILHGFTDVLRALLGDPEQTHSEYIHSLCLLLTYLYVGLSAWHMENRV